MPTSRAFEKLFSIENGNLVSKDIRRDILNNLQAITIVADSAIGKGQADRKAEVKAITDVGASVKAIAARFDSFAATVQNRIDTDAGGPLTLTGSLDAQVQRALSQALRRGGAYQNQTAATLGSYQPPTTLTPSAYSAASGAYTAGGYLAPTSGYSASTAPPASGIPAIASVMTGLPPDQSVLVREALITQQDLLSSLDALQPLSVQPDPGDIEAYKNVIRAEVMTLTTEFARPDLPRPARGRVLFGGLLGWSFPADKSFPADTTLHVVQVVGPPPTGGTQTGDVAALLFLLNLGRPTVPSAFVDQQDALQAVVSADALRLLQLWIAFQFAHDDQGGQRVPSMWPGVDTRLASIGGSVAVGARPPGNVQTFPHFPASPPFPAPPQPPTGTFSDRLIAANLLLPVIAEDAARVAGALDAIGFGPGPQETTPIDGLQSEVDADLGGLDANSTRDAVFPAEPVLRAQAAGTFAINSNTFTGGQGPTIKDVLDWAADLAGGASLDLIGQAGQLGLNLIADQADELFFIVIAILTQARGTSVLEEAFKDSQVDLELRSLARDLSELADQGI